ncbi:MAG: hypothetical protein KBG02_08220 [Haliscomenobacter sp.]|nr:hypothetical protein [Haliscomenobacter sp.]MBP9874536.1 hypothetical protein [Haliscomenobacter sp.]
MKQCTQIGSKIYINNNFGWVAKKGDPDKFLLIEYDLATKRSEFFIQHPASIEGKNFDNSTFRHMKFTCQERDQTILFSFNFDPYIYEFSGNKNDTPSYYCAPKDYELPEALKPGISSDAIWIHFQTHFSFSDIRFDPFRNTILRTALVPYLLEDIKSGSVI